MRNVRRISVVIGLFIAMAFVFAACGKSESGEASLTADRIEVNTGNELVYSIAQQGSNSSIVMQAKAVGDGRFCVLSCAPDGSVGAFFFSERELSALAQAKNTVIWTLYRTDGGAYAVEGFSEYGQSMAFLELSLPAEQVRRAAGMCVDSQDTLYICWCLSGGRTAVTALSSTLEVLYTIECSGECFGFALSGDTPVCLLSGSRLKLVDTENRDWGETVKPDIDIISIFSAAEGELLLSAAGTSLYYCELDGGKLVRLFRGADSFVDGYILSAVKLDSGEYAMVTQTDLYLLTDSPAEHDGREVITIASDGSWDALAERVMEFNRTNEDFRIVLENVENRTLFTTRLLAGDVPDAFFIANSITGTMDAETLGRAGYLADMYDYIDGDSVLSRDSFIPNILKAAEHDGVLWQLPECFNIDVMAADRSVASELTGLSFTQLRDILEEMQFDGFIFGPSFPRSFVLSKLLSVNMDYFVDWKAGEASFDSAEFQDLLYICKQYAPDEPYDDGLSPRERVENGDMLFRWENISSVAEVQRFDYFFDDPVLTGFPSPDGRGNTLTPMNCFSMSSTSTYGQIIWELIRDFYLPEFYREAYSTGNYTVTFSINAEAMEEKLADPGMDRREGGVRFATDRYSITIGEPTGRDVETIRAVLDSIDRTSRSDSKIYAIAAEEAAAYFAGDKTVEQTTAMIQSRVQLYLGERG